MPRGSRRNESGVNARSHATVCANAQVRLRVRKLILVLLVACGAKAPAHSIATEASCDDYRVATDAYPDIADRAGRSAQAARCYREAIADFRIAVAREPLRDYYLDLCGAFVAAHRDDEAIRCQQQALAPAVPDRD